MYKVFIENKPILFQINSQLEINLDIEATWRRVNDFLSSNDLVLSIEIKNKKEFKEIFKNHKYIEAAGGIVQRDNGYLFIKRNGVWDIPKGKLEKGETPKIAAIREIEEECGLIAPKIKKHLIDTWHTYPHKGKNVLKRTYWYWLMEGDEVTELVPQTEEGITELNYYALYDFIYIQQNTYLSIIDVMEALKKKL